MAHASEKRILVVDDEPDVRNFLAACIEDAGFQVETAEDGIEALLKIEQNPPDLMTLDMIMPRKSGIKVMRTLRENEKWAGLPVIVITAHARDEFGSEDIRGFNAFASGLRPRYTMEKPVTPEKLVQAIAEILQVDVEENARCVDQFDDEADCEAVLKMVRESDSETLKTIKALLEKK